ncbi:MAG: hypothetical protein BroJett030_10830 [Alphaproteobacteria bacterium]|nr:MAG: hypothetical protein BroJett030_10830 [Alphaproteobacteria bacterium]
MTSRATGRPAAGECDARLASPMARWLGFETTERADVFRMRFAPHHIGNPFIRALHGGAVAALIEFAAEYAVTAAAGRARLVSSAVDYIRVTRDADVLARVDTVRIGRRLAFVDVWCWQDGEDVPVARGSCSLRIL